jgi:hypothetical protein
VVEGAYVTTTTNPATLSDIVLDQWIHPCKLKFYNYDIALYIKLTLVGTPKMQYQFCGYVAIAVFHTCSIHCFDFYPDICKGFFLDRHIKKQFRNQKYMFAKVA